MARKEKKYHFIYKTTNVLSGKYYIGMHSTDNLNDGYMGSGTRLRYSINKHGEENHKREILEFVDSRIELKKREEEIVTMNEVAKVDCMNLKVGGYGGFKDDEHRKKCSDAGNIAYSERIKNDDEFRSEVTKRLMDNTKQAHENGNCKYDNFKGKTHNEESKVKMSNKAKERVGKKNSQYGTCWITNNKENKKIKKEDLDIYIKDGWERGRTNIIGK
jgi:hypothetical protein